MTTLGKLLVAGVVLASFASGLVRADDRKDQEAVQGTWIFTRHEVDGNDGGGTEDSQLTITIEADRYAIRLAGVVVQEGRARFDTSKTPRTVDAIIGEGQNKGTTMLGIYQLDGDTFRVCFDATGKVRPTEFKTSAGSNRLLVEGKRKK